MKIQNNKRSNQWTFCMQIKTKVTVSVLTQTFTHTFRAMKLIEIRSDHKNMHLDICRYVMCPETVSKREKSAYVLNTKRQTSWGIVGGVRSDCDRLLNSKCCLSSMNPTRCWRLSYWFVHHILSNCWMAKRRTRERTNALSVRRRFEFKSTIFRRCVHTFF